MSTFVTSVTIRLRIEAEDVRQANKKVHVWRKFIMAALCGRLAEAGVSHVRIPAPVSQPFKDFVEVDTDWLENEKLRGKFKHEWEYETHEVPIIPGSKIMLTHKVALGPKE